MIHNSHGRQNGPGIYKTFIDAIINDINSRLAKLQLNSMKV